MGALHDRDDLPWVEASPGISRRVLAGERLMLVEIRIDADRTVAAHAHPHEQIGYVLEGRVRFRTGGSEKILGPGGTYSVPGGEEHSAEALGAAARLVEVFTPPREDFR
ncbi:MAG: cupin domain-containing protein [Anaerolineae bacterium]|nr:cupin domain-containing protein [Anaerolineae bacterium]